MHRTDLYTKCFASLLALCSIAVSDAIGDDFIYEEPPDLSNHGFSPTNFGPFKLGLHTISGGLNSEGTGQGDSGDAFRLQNTQDWIVTSVMVSVEVPPESGPVTVICNPCGNSVVVSESTTFEFLPEPSNTFGNWLFNVVRRQSGGLVNVTYTWTIAVQSCSGDDAPSERVDIPIPPPPDLLPPFGCGDTLWSKESLLGERLEIIWQCSPSGDYYDFVYFGPEQQGAVGLCHFNEGANKAYYTAPPPRVAGASPDFFQRTGWMSIDGYEDHDSDGCLDVYQHFYDVCNDKYSRYHFQYEYIEGCNPISEQNSFLELKDGCQDFRNWSLCSPVEQIDPPLGPETEALFDELLAELIDFPHIGDSVMGELSQLLCDIDLDGDCDGQDQVAGCMQVASCFEDEAYYLLMDINGDGCITPVDIEYLFLQDCGAVPTLSEWGLVAMSALLLAAGYGVVSRRRRAAA